MMEHLHGSTAIAELSITSSAVHAYQHLFYSGSNDLPDQLQ